LARSAVTCASEPSDAAAARRGWRLAGSDLIVRRATRRRGGRAGASGKPLIGREPNPGALAGCRRADYSHFFTLLKLRCAGNQGIDEYNDALSAVGGECRSLRPE
jgi:hypothetical protein